MPLFNNRQIDPIWKVSFSTNIPSKNVKEEEQKKNIQIPEEYFFVLFLLFGQIRRMRNSWEKTAQKKENNRKKKFYSGILLYFFLIFSYIFLLHFCDMILMIFYIIIWAELHYIPLYCMNELKKSVFLLCQKKFDLSLWNFLTTLAFFCFLFWGDNRRFNEYWFWFVFLMVTLLKFHLIDIWHKFLRQLPKIR